MTEYLIIRRGAKPDGVGYGGPACVIAGIPPSRVYSDVREAWNDVDRLTHAENNIPFDVVTKPVLSGLPSHSARRPIVDFGPPRIGAMTMGIADAIISVVSCVEDVIYAASFVVVHISLSRRMDALFDLVEK